MKASAGDAQGDFCFATIRDSGGIQNYAVPNGPDAVPEMVALVEAVSVEHQNVYFSWALFRSGSIIGNKGRAEDNAVGLLCAVLEFDQKNDPETRGNARLPGEPTAEVESSAGNFHCQYWFASLCPVDAATKPTLEAIQKTAGADSCFSFDHLWRVPGTWNWPDDKKRKSRLSPEPSIWSTPPTERTVTLQELQAALRRHRHSRAAPRAMMCKSTGISAPRNASRSMTVLSSRS